LEAAVVSTWFAAGLVADGSGFLLARAEMAISQFEAAHK
jgi:hypothetical protein